MDKKCERCFLKYWVSAPDSIDPAIGKWYCVISGKWCSATGLECKLTDDNIISFGAAILQAIAGEGRLALDRQDQGRKTCEVKSKVWQDNEARVEADNYEYYLRRQDQGGE